MLKAAEKIEDDRKPASVSRAELMHIYVLLTSKVAGPNGGPRD